MRGERNAHHGTPRSWCDRARPSRARCRSCQALSSSRGERRYRTGESESNNERKRPLTRSATDPYATDLDTPKELIIAGGFREGDVFEYLVDSTEELEQVIAQLFQKKPRTSPPIRIHP
jgi:hypothetical protein